MATGAHDVAKTGDIRLQQTLLSKKRFHFETTYFTEEDIDYIIRQAGANLNKKTRDMVENGSRSEPRVLLKKELEGMITYVHWRLRLRDLRGHVVGPALMGPEPRSTKENHIFDYIIFQLGRLWTDPRIFAQSKVGSSIAASGGNARGPFVRMVMAVFKVLEISKTPNAIRSSIRKSKIEYREIRRKVRVIALNKEKAFIDKLSDSGR